MDEHDRIRAAMAKLGEVLTGIAITADAKNGERCPYKTAAQLCTFHGGCRNQRHINHSVHCGGDHQLVRIAPL
jgi:hypothetical protein